MLLSEGKSFVHILILKPVTFDVMLIICDVKFIYTRTIDDTSNNIVYLLQKC